MSECNSVKTTNISSNLSDQKKLDWMKSIRSNIILIQKSKKEK